VNISNSAGGIPGCHYIQIFQTQSVATVAAGVAATSNLHRVANIHYPNGLLRSAHKLRALADSHRVLFMDRNACLAEWH